MRKGRDLGLRFFAGQPAADVAEQLRNRRAGKVREPSEAFMRTEAQRLSPADTNAVAAYVAKLVADKATKS